uniref:SET domain-containing protein n=1 Tax=Glossina morsitans morsitans TaxID=37546 RepID=A0A1B0G1M5_GLOMM
MTEEFNEKCKIAQNDTLGRYVQACENIKAGEPILNESPILIIACPGDRRCSNCFRLTQSYCGKCSITPLCSNCRSHHLYDCNTLSLMSKEVQFENLRKNPESYGLLKLFLLKENPDTAEYFEKILQLESHLDKRRNTTIWQEHNDKVVQPLLHCGMKEYFKYDDTLDEDSIQRLCGILDVNAYEIRAPDQGGMRGLYLNASTITHQCNANANVAIDHQYRIKVYANRDIDKDETISTCYTNILLGTDERRRILQEGKYFHCTCNRCEDPTEFGSHMSSFVCTPCMTANRNGIVVKKTTTENKCKWECMVCNHSMRDEQIKLILEKAKEEIYHARDDLKRYEILLAKLSRILHQNHYLMVDIKQNLANILRSIITSSMQRPGRCVYERKVRLCQELVMVLHIIQPGISRLKAIALYELANASAELYRLKFGEKELTDKELVSMLQRCEAMLREAARMLLYEPVQTPEGELAHAAMDELRDMLNDIKLLKEKIDEVN